MRHPGAVVSGPDLAQFVFAHPLAGRPRLASGSFLIGICAAMPPMACAPRRWQVAISRSTYDARKWLVMVTWARSGRTQLGVVAEFLDEAEDVIPAAAVQAGRVLAQLPQDLVHLKGGQDGFDQHGRADGAARDSERVLRHQEDVVPQAGFQAALQLRQVEVRARCRCGSASRALWKKNRPKSKSEAEMGSPSIRKCFSTRCQPRGRTIRMAGVLAEFVVLALGAGVGDGAVHRVAQIDLAFHDVLPGGRVGILEVGHEDVGAGVQRVDDHLAVGRPGDLDAPVAKVGRRLGDLPAGSAGSPPSLPEKSGISPASISLLASAPCLQQLPPARFERGGQFHQETYGLRA